jgi:hypothetical protein
MKFAMITLVAGSSIIFAAIVSANARGVCSTAKYNTSIACCTSGIAGVSNPALCKQH